MWTASASASGAAILTNRMMQLRHKFQFRNQARGTAHGDEDTVSIVLVTAPALLVGAAGGWTDATL